MQPRFDSGPKHTICGMTFLIPHFCRQDNFPWMASPVFPNHQKPTLILLINFIFSLPDFQSASLEQKTWNLNKVIVIILLYLNKIIIDI